jgi:hypothetical protein
MEKNVLSIHMQIQGTLAASAEEMSLVMIKALMDELDISTTDENTVIDMSKNHKMNLFE